MSQEGGRKRCVAFGIDGLSLELIISCYTEIGENKIP